ncbi:hypothetical protein GGX14DRAFT_426811 [Mycena pura]|uniref:Uncharacterized protein n=1 Tax=Mycena pura TaxID=153505 RepID=A0AAD7E1G2_9AGAR|nr:hypothetical protein GGX14DRAFT_426811 [Mycena pura]
MSLVILDDQSSSLKYTGIWTGGGTTSHYDHTASASRAAGASMAYSFTGTTIAVVGSYDANTSCTGTFALDSNVTTFSSPVLSAPLNHQTIWSSALLSDAEHTLTYTLASCTSSSAGYVWFDYILYTASASNASTDGVVYFIDDSDSRIAYSGNWTAETSNDGDFQLTSHGGKQGCSFQLEFEGMVFIQSALLFSHSFRNCRLLVFFRRRLHPSRIFCSLPKQYFLQPALVSVRRPSKRQTHSCRLVPTSRIGLVLSGLIICCCNPIPRQTIPR